MEAITAPARLLVVDDEATIFYPGGIVDRVVAIGNGDYEVHYIGVNWPHHIFVNQDFQVIGAND
jgi:hypothetical protein